MSTLSDITSLVPEFAPEAAVIGKSKRSGRLFGPGNIVILRSGGPQMTVDHTDKYGCHVVWFVDEQLCTAHLGSESLALVKE